MSKKQALIVDDHPTILSGLKKLLESMSFQTTTLSDAESALKSLRNNSYNLILLDMKLPDMDGKTLLNIIRISDSDTPILIISEYSNTSDSIWMLQHGAQGFIDKKEPTLEFKKAITAVSRGETYAPQHIQTLLKSTKDILVEPYVGITKQQEQIIELLNKHYTYEQISEELSISSSRIKAYIQSLFSDRND